MEIDRLTGPATLLSRASRSKAPGCPVAVAHAEDMVPGAAFAGTRPAQDARRAAASPITKEKIGGRTWA